MQFLASMRLQTAPSRAATPDVIVGHVRLKANRRLTDGPNTFEDLGRKRLTRMLVIQFFSIVFGFLLTAAILNSAVEDNMEAFAILATVVIGVIVGFVHLFRAAQALDAIGDAAGSPSK